MRFVWGIVLFVGLIWPFTGDAQPKPAKPAPKGAINVHEKVYLMARRTGDLSSATMALFYWMEFQPERKDLVDSLCFVYFYRGMFPQSAAVARDILKKRPSNLPVREILAQDYENTGAYTDAIFQYQQLFEAAPKPLFLYKLAALNYLNKDYTKAEEKLRQLEALPNAGKETIYLNYQGEAVTGQQVPLMAAIDNIRGVIFLDKTMRDEAVRAFQSALLVFPEFVMARRNLEIAQKLSN